MAIDKIAPWMTLKYIVLALPPAAIFLLLSKRSQRRSEHTVQDRRKQKEHVCESPRDHRFYGYAHHRDKGTHFHPGSYRTRKAHARPVVSSHANVAMAASAAVFAITGLNVVETVEAFVAAGIMTVGRSRADARVGTERQAAKPYLSGKVVWVTGASSGLGEQLAVAAAEGGARGVILSGRRQDALERVRQSCEAARSACADAGGGHAGAAVESGVRVLPFDMGELDCLEEQAKKAVAAFGGVDVLALNAGVSTRATVEDTSIDVAKQVMAVNYFGAVALAKGLLTAQPPRPEGMPGPHFVVVNSVQGKFGMASRSSYCASKHALVGFFDCLRAETAHLGVRVTTVLPGYIRTSLSLNAVTGDGSRHAQMDKSTAAGREPREVAHAVWTAAGDGKDEVVIADFKVKLAILLRALAPQTLFGIMAKRALKGEK